MRIILIYSLLTISTICGAQKATGTVTSIAGDTISFAQIELIDLLINEPIDGTYSDKYGVFSIRVPQQNTTYQIRINSIGYEQFITKAFKDSIDLGTIQLLVDQNEMDVTLIQIDKKIIEQTGRGMNVNIASSPLLENSNAKEILSQIPGVTMNQDGSLSLNGQRNVQVFINGKPSLLSLDLLVQMLESTPGSEIEKIEVFNTPPPKFDAEGSGGIVNIIKKKNSQEGGNGNTGLNSGRGKYQKTNAWSNFNFRKGKINVYGSLNGQQNKFHFNHRVNLSSTYNNSYQQINNVKLPIFTNRNLAGKIGLDLFIDSNTTIGVLISPYTGDFDAFESTNATVMAGDYDYENTTGNRDFEFDWHGNTYNLNLERKINKGSWNFDADYIYNYNGTDQISASKYWNENTLVNNEQYLLDVSIALKAFTGKIDFEKSLKNNWSLSSGGKISLLKMDNFSNRSFSSMIENWDAKTAFTYRENISGVYFSVNKNWSESWKFNCGFRAENTILSGNFDTSNLNFDRAFFNLFPNAAISYLPNENWNHSLSYTKRIARPDYQELTPFEERVNPYLISKGNSNLNPELIQTLNYKIGLKSKYFLTLSSHLKNNGTFLTPNHKEGEIVQVYQFQNIGNQFHSSIAGTVPVKLTKWWTINNNVVLFRNQLIKAGDLNFNFTSFNARMQNQFNLKNGWKAEFIGFYQYKHYWNVWYQDPFFRFDASLSKKINNWKFTLSGNDIFGLRVHSGGQKQAIVQSETRFEPEKQVYRVSITYNFGNQKLKKQRERGTGSEDVQKRSSKK